MLTGKDLLAKVKDLGDVSKSDLVKACGYVSTKKGGGERLNYTAFYEATRLNSGIQGYRENYSWLRQLIYRKSPFWHVLK